jgi:hypothetical protein
MLHNGFISTNITQLCCFESKLKGAEHRNIYSWIYGLDVKGAEHRNICS